MTVDVFWLPERDIARNGNRQRDSDACQLMIQGIVRQALAISQSLVNANRFRLVHGEFVHWRMKQSIFHSLVAHGEWLESVYVAQIFKIQRLPIHPNQANRRI